MDRISAGGNLTIELQSDKWRLMVNGSGVERVLVEAAPGQPLRYVPTFGAKRRLPPDGALDAEQVQRVVLGWSNKDEAWHLGLLLEPELAEPRGSRWCEIAHWPDPEITLYRDIAVRAGEGLAQNIYRPFTLIPPRTNAGTLPAEQPAPPLPALPLKLDLWTLHTPDPARETMLEFRLASSWARSRLFRVAWQVFWVGVFIVLAGLSLISGIALPRPEFLPYLGFLSAALLIIAIFVNLFQVWTHTNRILVDGERKVVRGMHGRREKWRRTLDDLQSVYITQVVGKVGRGKPSVRSVYYGELNLFLRDGEFQHLLALGRIEDKIPMSAEGDFDDEQQAMNAEQVMLLTAYHAQTRLQAAALYTSRALGVPCFYDRRLK